jgi:two-component system, chemotaxis family, protein-glutamate methylesterase/glutaminase
MLPSIPSLLRVRLESLVRMSYHRAKQPTMSPGTIGTHINKRRARRRARASVAPVAVQTGMLPAAQRNTPQLLAIAASTGGPSALQTILLGLGSDFPLPTLVAQHIARGFVEGMAAWLNRTTPLPVHVAQLGEPLLPGHVYLAPDEQHLLAGAGAIVCLQPSAASDRYCPSADLLFEGVAAIYGSRALGVILTGMGNDGARGLAALRAAGSITLAQNEASCVVYGMPQAAVAAGAVVRIEPLSELAGAILQLINVEA